jgi:hypothetical protein
VAWTGGAVVDTDARVILARAVDAETGARVATTGPSVRMTGRCDDLTRNIEIATTMLSTTPDAGSGLTDDAKAHLFEPVLTTKPPGGEPGSACRRAGGSRGSSAAAFAPRARPVKGPRSRSAVPGRGPRRAPARVSVGADLATSDSDTDGAMRSAVLVKRLA